MRIDQDFILLIQTILKKKQNIIFYSEKNLKNFLYFGNVLDFNSTKDDITKYAYNIEKPLFVFNKETMVNYKTKMIIILFY